MLLDIFCPRFRVPYLVAQGCYRCLASQKAAAPCMTIACCNCTISLSATMPTSKMYEPLKSVFQQAVAGLSKPTMFRMRPFRGNTCWSRLFICLLRQWRALKNLLCGYWSIYAAEIFQGTPLPQQANKKTAPTGIAPKGPHAKHGRFGQSSYCLLENGFQWLVHFAGRHCRAS